MLKKYISILCLSLISTQILAKSPSNELMMKMKSMGDIQKMEPFVSGLTAWTITAKNQKTGLFFTTADEKTIIHGTVYDADTKKNLSNSLKNKGNTLKTNPNVPANTSIGHKHEVFTAVKKLQGIIDGKKENPNTVYILFDPRCTYCHEAYNKTRRYVENGASIKWIPLLVINQSENGKQLAAGLLRNNNINTLDKAFNGSDDEKNKIKVIPTSKELGILDLQTQFLNSVFFHHEDIVIVPHDEKIERQNLRNKGLTPKPLKAGVPLAIFVNKKGQLEARRGVSEDIALEYIFNN